MVFGCLSLAPSSRKVKPVESVDTAEKQEGRFSMKRVLMVAVFALLGVSVLFGAGQQDVDDSGEKTISVFPERFTPGVDRAIETLPPLTAFDEIARQYEELNPGVDIEFYNYPGDASNSEEYMSWLTTQSIAGTLPELVFAHSTELEAFSDNDWFVDLMPYLEEPNPYVEGNERWIDLFGEEIIATRQSAAGELWSLPISLVATSIFYNQDLFDELGLSEPEDWEEFMNVLATIKEETDVIPFLYDMSTRSNTSWAYRVFLSFMYEPLLPEIDLDGDDIVSTEEFARAVKAEILGADNDRHRDILRMFHEWKDYFQSGFLSKPADGLFPRGQAAMWWGGIWELLPLEEDPMLDFELGTFYVPRITSATSEFADDETPVRMIGGASGVQLAVSRSAMEEGTVEESVDFLMYITTPENNGRITSESKELAPIVRGAEVDDSLKSFLQQANNGITPFVIERFFTSEQLDRWFRTMQLFLVEDISLEEATERLQAVYDDAADTLIEKNDYEF